MGADYPTCDPGLYPHKGTNFLSGLEETYCAPCPLGFYCQGGDKKSGKPIPCIEGYYGAAMGMSELELACKTCPAGSSCAAGSAFPKRCGPGYFADPGARECTMCSIGFHCPGNTANQIRCEAGHYAPNAGMDYCMPCPVGMSCEQKQGFDLIKPETCESGFYQDEPGQEKCKPCPDTHFCPEGSTVGHYCNGGKFLDSTTGLCVDCLAGHFCEIGEQMVVCDKGTFAEVGAQACSECPQGHFCPEGAKEPTQC